MNDHKDCKDYKQFGYESGVDLKTYFDIRLTAMDKAIDVARASMEKRLDAMNEFRDTLKDQNTTFLTKTDYTGRHQSLEQKIEALEKLVYMGMGMLLALEFILKFFVK